MTPAAEISTTITPRAMPAEATWPTSRTDRRVLLLCVLAVPIGAIGALVAKALLWLIAVITNPAFFLRLSAAPVPADRASLRLVGCAGAGASADWSSA